MKDKDSSKTALTYLAVGSAVGSVTALAFAPSSGKKLRDSIKTSVVDLSEKLGVEAKNAKHKLQKSWQRTGKKGETVTKGADKKLHKTEKDVKKSVKSVGTKAKKIIKKTK